MFSTASSLVTSSFMIVALKGYRLTMTMSMGSILSSSSCRMWSGLERMAKSPAWTIGCRVFTRPSRHSGNPVSSEISMAFIPSSISFL